MNFFANSVQASSPGSATASRCAYWLTLRSNSILPCERKILFWALAGRATSAISIKKKAILIIGNPLYAQLWPGTGTPAFEKFQTTENIKYRLIVVYVVWVIKLLLTFRLNPLF